MDGELTLDQAREIDRLRRRHPGARLLAHQRSWGVIVEVRRGRQTVALCRFDWAGASEPDHRIFAAA